MKIALEFHHFSYKEYKSDSKKNKESLRDIVDDMNYRLKVFEKSVKLLLDQSEQKIITPKIGMILPPDAIAPTSTLSKMNSNLSMKIQP